MNSGKETVQLASLVNMNSSEAVLEEVKRNFINFYSLEDFSPVRHWYHDFLRLYRGEYEGYLKCNTPFHNIKHITDVFLAFSRLVDGYNIEEGPLPIETVRTGFISSLFHDSGFIQKEYEDYREGTGAQYIATHVERSLDFVRTYIGRKQLCIDTASAGRMIQITDLQMDISAAGFQNPDEKTVGAMVATADLIGQMASRTYLEKLLFLYREYEEAQLPGYNTELDLLKKTRGFYEKIVIPRLRKDFSGLFSYNRAHFRERYSVDADLYTEAIERQLCYLEYVLQESPEAYKERLRRTQ